MAEKNKLIEPATSRDFFYYKLIDSNLTGQLSL